MFDKITYGWYAYRSASGAVLTAALMIDWDIKHKSLQMGSWHYHFCRSYGACFRLRRRKVCSPVLLRAWWWGRSQGAHLAMPAYHQLHEKAHYYSSLSFLWWLAEKAFYWEIDLGIMAWYRGFFWYYNAACFEIRYRWPGAWLFAWWIFLSLYEYCHYICRWSRARLLPEYGYKAA